MSMRVRDLAAAMARLAPLDLAEPWDNVGLLAGAEDDELRGPVLLAIDLTERVLDEAVAAKASTVVAYHPPIWEPMRRVTDATVAGRIMVRALRAGLAIYSPHTALDAAPGGVTDWLCDGLAGEHGGGADRRALVPGARLNPTEELKIVTFVPPDALERVRNALAAAGAGIIGQYRVCSFSVPGTGTFLGAEGTHPAVGQPGRLEEVSEWRLEMVCSRSALPLAMATLRQFHPYEEPAVDVYALLPRPDRSAGAGRRLVLDQPATLSDLAERLKRHLGIPVVNVAAAHDSGVRVSRIGVCPGSGAALAPVAAADGCEVFITGEMKHHEVLAALHRGMSVILAGHTNTERGYLPILAGRLAEVLDRIEVRVAASDRSPRVPV